MLPLAKNVSDYRTGSSCYFKPSGRSLNCCSVSSILSSTCSGLTSCLSSVSFPSMWISCLWWSAMASVMCNSCVISCSASRLICFFWLVCRFVLVCLCFCVFLLLVVCLFFFFVVFLVC